MSTGRAAAVSMHLTRGFAVVTIVGVGAAAFRLSFATLKDLAVIAHVPADQAWLLPVVIDGTILLATLGTLVLANSPDRRYFVRLLIIGAVVSIVGNCLHAVVSGLVLPVWASAVLAAVVAAIAPVSLLADTHGLAVLLRAAQHNSTPAPAPVPLADEVADQPAETPAPAPEPEPVPSVVPRPRPAVVPVRSIRPVRPVQEALPITVS
ncbi:DUF2637 domain-containing protein [Nocardia suismassiliense]|uniref:DUF2637 domain-containing protein n=1 Tax=Nocardia suismassiliense TaxID=2077092 RepID=UPI001F2CED63|nr:DUF2637 domain-containing protein [Nocardia suismassiliense]